jgi:hypothetical protein
MAIQRKRKDPDDGGSGGGGTPGTPASPPSNTSRKIFIGIMIVVAVFVIANWGS